MGKMLPEAVEAILGQLDRDGMLFQSYKLCGSPYQAVLVMRFTCQKLHLPWMEAAEPTSSSKQLLMESTTTASAPSTRSETQDTSYMGMPDYRNHCSQKPEAAAWHDSGLDLTTSDNHDEVLPQDRDRDKVEEHDLLAHSPTPDDRVMVVCSPNTLTNLVSPLTENVNLPHNTRGRFQQDDGYFHSLSDAHVQTELDLEYMKRLIEEFSATEYLPTTCPFSHLRGSKTSTGSSLTDSQENDTTFTRKHPLSLKHRETQTDGMVPGVDIQARAVLSDNNIKGKNLLGQDTQPTHRSQGIQTTDYLQVPHELVRRSNLLNPPGINASMQTDILLDSINKAIQTAEYLEDYIQHGSSPKVAMKAQLEAPNRGKPIEMVEQDTQTEEQAFCYACVRYREGTPAETISIASQDLELQLEPEYDSEDTFSEEPDTAGTIKRNLRLHSISSSSSSSSEDGGEHEDKEVPSIQYSEFASQTSLTQVDVQEIGTDPIILETEDKPVLVDMASDPHVTLGDLLEEYAPQIKVVENTDEDSKAHDESIHTRDTEGENEDDKTQRDSFDFFAQYLPGSSLSVNKGSDKMKKLTIDSTFSTPVEYQDDFTQTDKSIMITRGVGIRVKTRHCDCQTDNDLMGLKMAERPKRVNPVQRAQLRVFQDPDMDHLPGTSSSSASKQKSKKVQRSVSVDGARKSVGKKRKHKGVGKSSAATGRAGSSTSTLSPMALHRHSAPVFTGKDAKKIYSEEDFRSFVEGLPPRIAPEIHLQGGSILGVIQGVLKLRSGGPDIWLEALYLCVLQEFVVPLYCSGGHHKNCMAGQLIDLQLENWQKDFALFKAKGSFESAHPGMKAFADAQACCQATMGAKVKTDVAMKKSKSAGKGSQPNKCANQ